MKQTIMLWVALVVAIGAGTLLNVVLVKLVIRLVKAIIGTL